MIVGSVGLDNAFVRDESKSLSSYEDMSDSAQPVGIENLVARFDGGEFDLVAIGRALLADPNWPEKIRNGQTHKHIAFSKTMLATLT